LPFDAVRPRGRPPPPAKTRLRYRGGRVVPSGRDKTLMAGPGIWVAAGFFALVVVVGMWSFWRHWSHVLETERRRSAGYRQSLVKAATLAAAAKNVRCPTCLTNWGSIQTLLDLAIVSGDSVG